MVDKNVYCRKLGHDVNLDYCLNVNQKLPCRNVINCWQAVFDIEQYLESNYTSKDLKRIFSPPKDKRVQLFELIKKAQKIKK